jgi:hypothetical protein
MVSTAGATSARSRTAQRYSRRNEMTINGKGMITERLYEECWEGADSPLAATAFISGQSAVIDKISSYLADQPAKYEDAVGEDTWKERIINAIEQGL